MLLARHCRLAQILAVKELSATTEQRTARAKYRNCLLSSATFQSCSLKVPHQKMISKGRSETQKQFRCLKKKKCLQCVPVLLLRSFQTTRYQQIHKQGMCASRGTIKFIVVGCCARAAYLLKLNVKASLWELTDQDTPYWTTLLL